MSKEITTIKVRRLKSDCCGMIVNHVYPAIANGSYVRCQLPDGTWTGPHWGLYEGWFEKTMNLGFSTEIGVCDDCLHLGNGEQKPVKRIDDDNIYFCRTHWQEHWKSFEEAGYKVNKFLEIVK